VYPTISEEQEDRFREDDRMKVLELMYGHQIEISSSGTQKNHDIKILENLAKKQKN
jgi:phosphotransferase system HPr-like phosphotransfer protein